MSEKQAYQIARWSLEDLVAKPGSPEVEAIFETLEQSVVAFEATRDDLNENISEARFQQVLSMAEQVGYTIRQLNGFSYLWLSECTADAEALAFRSRVDTTLADAQNRVLFFELWWKGLEAKTAARLSNGIGDLEYYLASLRKFAPYTLSEGEEQVINLKDVNGVNGHNTLYDMMTNDFTYQVEIDGEVKTLTRTEVALYTRSKDPEHRAAAYQAMNAVFAEQGNVLGQIYTYVVGDWYSENITLRGMESPISARNLVNDLPDDVVNTLLESCRTNRTLFHRYFRLKAAWCGMDKLRRYDVYAPVGALEKTVEFPEGVDEVLDTMRAFSPEMAALAERVLAENHLDSEVRKGKDTGAFCFGVVPDKTPWVLVNYNKKLDDVSTLGHELGHAIHSMLASDHSTLTFRSSLPLAETASNFIEILLLKRWLREETDPENKRTLLAKFVDDAFASILRQSYFVLFEREAHDAISKGGTTIDALCDLYFENLKEQFGDALDLSEDFKWEWTSIPHNYQVPFYCYAYAFGLLLVLALYREYERTGEDFVPKYLRVLSYGGSKAPLDILDEAGFNIRSAAFWQGGFDVIAEMVEELEKLTAKTAS